MTISDHDRLKRFAELVSAYGARPEAWPEDERGWARGLMRASPEARHLLAAAAEVDGWLDSVPVPPAPAGLEERILASAPVLARREAKRAGRAGASGRLQAWLDSGMNRLPAARPACAVAAAAIAGLLLGWGGVFSEAVSAGEEEEIVAMAFVGSGLDRYDLGEWQ